MKRICRECRMKQICGALWKMAFALPLGLALLLGGCESSVKEPDFSAAFMSGEEAKAGGEDGERGEAAQGEKGEAVQEEKAREEAQKEAQKEAQEEAQKEAQEEAQKEAQKEKNGEEVAKEASRLAKAVDFSVRESPVDQSRYDKETDKRYKQAFLAAVTNQMPIQCPDKGKACFYQELLPEAGQLREAAFLNEVKSSDYFYQDFDGDGLPELIVNTEGPCVLKYHPDKDQVELFLKKEPGWNLLGCGQMLYEDQGWEDGLYCYRYGYEWTDPQLGVRQILLKNNMASVPEGWYETYQISVGEYQDAALGEEAGRELYGKYFDLKERAPHPMSFSVCFGEGGEEGYLPGSQPPPRYWLEGTKPLPINQEEGEEWELYQRMLKGDFSLVDDERWGILQWEYEDALEEGNGKCNWDYFLMDFDQDGSREMVIRLYPEGVNNTAFFRYADGKVKMWGFFHSADSHGYMLPLANGKILSVNWYGDDRDWWIQRLDPWGHCVSEKSYSTGMRGKNPETLEGTGDLDPCLDAEREWYCSFWDYYHDGSPCWPEISLSEEEWEPIERIIEGLFIPEEAWKPCSVFTPMEERPEIPSVG